MALFAKPLDLEHVKLALNAQPFISKEQHYSSAGGLSLITNKSFKETSILCVLL